MSGHHCWFHLGRLSMFPYLWCSGFGSSVLLVITRTCGTRATSRSKVPKVSDLLSTVLPWWVCIWWFTIVYDNTGGVYKVSKIVNKASGYTLDLQQYLAISPVRWFLEWYSHTGLCKDNRSPRAPAWHQIDHSWSMPIRRQENSYMPWCLAQRHRIVW